MEENVSGCFFSEHSVQEKEKKRKQLNTDIHRQ